MCCTGLYNEHIWVGSLVGLQIWPGLSRLSSLYWSASSYIRVGSSSCALVFY